MREFLRGLDLDDELVDTIMAEYGKLVTKDKEELQTLREQVRDLEEYSSDAEILQQKYEELLVEKEERVAQEEEKALDDEISALFDGKEFTSDYARNGLLNDIKKELKNPSNEKDAKTLFKEFTKDKTDIFTNPNQLKDMESMGDSEQNNNAKETPIIW